MIKIDVEGYEEHVLRGSSNVLANSLLKAIELETVSDHAAQILKGHGFERVNYDPYQRLIADTPVGFGPSNALFVRDREFVSARVREAAKVCIMDQVI